MKKLSSFLLAVMMTVVLTGCGASDTNDRDMSIESYDWVMNTVQENTGRDKIVAYGAGQEAVPDDAVPFQLTCKAENGTLTLEDETQTHSGIYELTGQSSSSSIYGVNVEGQRGTAVVSVTEYHDGSEKMTLIMRLETHTINCFESTK